MNEPAVLRFAPSPNGYLHLGHALSALTCAAFAQTLCGRLLLRIEDIDVGRCRDVFVDAIMSDLHWLGVAHDREVLKQSHRFEAHQAAAARLKALGLLYPCFATRKDIAEAHRTSGAGRDPDGAPIVRGLRKAYGDADMEHRLSLGQRPAMRLDMTAALDRLEAATGRRTLTFTEFDPEAKPVRVVADPSVWGDVVLQRKDVPTSYHLSVVVDDAFQGITHVVRGQDLRDATGLQRLVQWLLGLPQPNYHHHRLILGPDGRKLSKSDKSTALKDLREAGWTADQVRQSLGF